MHNFSFDSRVKAPPGIVYAALKDIEKFPVIMKYVNSIKIKKTGRNNIVSQWLLDVEGADVAWEEKDLFNDKAKTFKFSMLKGDYSGYSGTWRVTPRNNGSLLSLDIKIDWDVPSFEKIIGPILETKMKRILRGMMVAIKIESQNVYKKSKKR